MIYPRFYVDRPPVYTLHTVYYRERSRAGDFGAYCRWGPWQQVKQVENASTAATAASAALNPVVMDPKTYSLQYRFMIVECEEDDEDCTVYVFCDNSGEVTFYKLEQPNV